MLKQLWKLRRFCSVIKLTVDKCYFSADILLLVFETIALKMSESHLVEEMFLEMSQCCHFPQFLSALRDKMHHELI